jgi:amino acid adenylation domain-containing protein
MSNRRFAREIAFNAAQYSREREYWKGRLSGELTRGSFPYDANNMEESGEDEAARRLEHLEFKLSGELFDKLIWTINNSDLRLYIILVAALVILLGKHTDREDITVGGPIERQDIEGNFLNTILAFRLRLSPEITFKALLMQTMQMLKEASENQNFPLERMPYELNMEMRENDAFALFDTAILLENIHEKSYIDHIPLNMLFSFARTGESINGMIEYNTALYKEVTVRGIIDRFIHLLRGALANVETPVLNLDIMPESEKEFLLFKMNDTRSEYPETGVHHLFEAQVEKKTGNIAVEEVDTGRTLTYGELNQRANQLEALLIERGVKKGTITAVMGERTGDIVVSILAILKAGGIFLPLDAQNPDDRLNFILEDSATRVFISQERIVNQREALFNKFSPRNIITMDDESIYKGDPALTCNDIRPTDPAYIIYTSGTTGKPKGVMVGHRSLTNYIHFANRSYTRGEVVNFPFYTSIAFDLTVTSIFTPLVSGNTVVVYSGWGKGNLIERIVDDKKVGVIKLTPSHLTLIGEKTVTGSAVRRFVVGGEALKYSVARKIFDNFNGSVEIYNEYGPTEATVGCMLYKFDPIKDLNNGNTVSIGVPAANAQIYLLNKNRSPVPTGAVGEMYIGGDGLARGYLNRPGLTADRFTTVCLSPSVSPAHLYRTGDLARWHSDGNIEFLGRIDHQVKLRGFRIELEEIECQLLTHESVKEAVVTVREAAGGSVYGYRTGDAHICAYFVSDDNLAVPDLKEYLVEKLPDYMVPSYFVRLDAVPLTANGKVDTRALPEPGIKTEVEYVPPCSEIEKKLVGIWSEILGLDAGVIGVHSNFFDLGGHSLSGTILAAKIHKALEVKLTLPDLFRLPVLKELAQHLEKSKKKQFTPIEAAEEKEYYPLSSAQARFFTIQRIDPHTTGYNVPMTYEIEGELCIEKLHSVFQEFIRRHTIFRTSFIFSDDNPVQRVQEVETVEFKIERFGVPADGEYRPIMKDFIRPFDLSRAPLLRVGLIQTDHSNLRFILMMDIHHIITDGVSMDILIKEFGVLYSGHQLPPRKLDYKDYSEWQNSEKRQEEMKGQESYWLKRFEGEIPVLELPTDFPRPPIRDFRGDSISFELDERVVSGLKELAAAQGATLFMVILSLYTVFLSKLDSAGREDIIVGSPIAGRRHTDLENIIGLFINTLALRNYPGGEKSFLKFLKEVKIYTLEAYENQEYQYEDLVARVFKRRDANRNPLTDVMFALNNVNTNVPDITEIDIPGLKMTPCKSDFLSSKVDILLNALEYSGKILFLLEYSTTLFKKETVERFIRYFKQVVTGVLVNPLQKISGIDILSRKEKEQILFEFNDTASDSPPIDTVRQIFEEQVEKAPDIIAVIAPSAGAVEAQDRQISYRELNRQSSYIVALLSAEGVVPGTIVGITAEPSLETIIGILGILKSGGAYMPVEPDSSQERIDYLLADSGAVLLLTGDWIGSARRYTRPVPPVRSNHPACVIYGLDPTGKPVGTLIENRNLIHYADWFAKKTALSNNDRTLLTEGLETDHGYTAIYPPLLRGSRLHIVPRQVYLSAERLLDCIRSCRITYMKVTLSMFGTLVENPSFTIENTRTLRLVVLEGGAAEVKDLEKARAVNGRLEIMNHYGPAEATAGCIARSIDFETFDLYKERPSIGYPVENTRALILDKNRNLLPIGVAGELFIAGDAVAGGYLNRPQLTANVFNTSYKSHKSYESYIFYKTGDLARWCPDGSIEYLGSADPANHGKFPAPLTEMDGFSAPPEDDVEEKLAAAWAEVLGLDKEIIGTDVNFFQLGGHSLNAVILVPKIHKLFDVEVPLTEFFKNPTIKGLAAYIKGAENKRFSAIEAAEKKEYYPGSLNQNRFYILQQMYPENTGYNNLQLFKLDGELNRDRLERAFNDLIGRHESLRTSFEMIEGKLVQWVHDKAALSMEFHNCPDEEKVNQVVKAFTKPFSLDKAPLLRVGLIRLGKSEHILVTDMHHIITDGLSAVILSREFIELYEGNILPPLMLQYRDFSEWQDRGYRQIKKQGEFWVKQFEDGASVLKLRTDYPRPPVQQFEGDRINFTINPENTAAVEKLVLQEESSVFMVLFAVYNILLWKLTGQDDIIIGTGVLNRGHTDLMEIIGLFFNTIPLRNRILGEIGFKKFLGGVKAKMLDAFDNQEYPIDILVEDLLSLGLLARDAGRNPLFDTMFALQNFGDIEGTAPKTGLTDLTVMPYELEIKTSRLDLFFAGTQGTDTIHMTAEYSTALFAPATIRKMTEYYVEILEQVLADNEIKLDDITLSRNLLEVKSTADRNEYMGFGF